MAFKTKNGWRAHGRLAGKRITKTFKTRREALRFEQDLLEGKDPNEPDKSELTFAEVAQEWMVKHCHVKKAPSQWKADQSVLANHLLPALGSKRLTELKAQDLEEIEAGLNQKLKPKSINNITATAKTIVRRAIRWGYLTGDPFKLHEPIKIEAQAFDYWTLDERDQFLDYAYPKDPDFARVVEFACHTGLRLGEIKALKRDAVDFQSAQIIVRRNYCYRWKRINEHTKSKQIGYVPMNETVKRLLEPAKGLTSSELVFSDFTLAYPPRRLRALAKKAGVKPIKFHDLRHTFASTLVMAGCDIYTVQKLLRHSDVKMTMRYAHLHPSFMAGQTTVLDRAVTPVSQKVVNLFAE